MAGSRPGLPRAGRSAGPDAVVNGWRANTPDLFAPAETGGVRHITREVWRIVAPNPSPLTGPGTNTYVVGERRRLVIDPGPADPVHLERILEFTGGAVDRIVCTHSHTDHSPGAAQLSARTGAAVLGMSAPVVDDFQDGTYAPDQRLVDGERIEGEDFALTALHTPGHASNHVCLLLDSGGLLFTGDHLMSGSTVVDPAAGRFDAAVPRVAAQAA